MNTNRGGSGHCRRNNAEDKLVYSEMHEWREEAGQIVFLQRVHQPWRRVTVEARAPVSTPEGKPYTFRIEKSMDMANGARETSSQDVTVPDPDHLAGLLMQTLGIGPRSAPLGDSITKEWTVRPLLHPGIAPATLAQTDPTPTTPAKPKQKPKATSTPAKPKATSTPAKPKATSTPAQVAEQPAKPKQKPTSTPAAQIAEKPAKKTKTKAKPQKSAKVFLLTPTNGTTKKRPQPQPQPQQFEFVQNRKKYSFPLESLWRQYLKCKNTGQTLLNPTTKKPLTKLTVQRLREENRAYLHTRTTPVLPF